MNWQHRYITWDKVQCADPISTTYPMEGYWKFLQGRARGVLKAKSSAKVLQKLFCTTLFKLLEEILPQPSN